MTTDIQHHVIMGTINCGKDRPCMYRANNIGKDRHSTTYHIRARNLCNCKAGQTGFTITLFQSIIKFNLANAREMGSGRHVNLCTTIR